MLDMRDILHYNKGEMRDKSLIVKDHNIQNKEIYKMNEAEVVKEKLYAMTEEEFERFKKRFPEETQQTFTAMRFFHRMFNDPAMYEAVCSTVGEMVYETLRAE